MFKDGPANKWTNVHDEERSDGPSVVSDELGQSVDQQICKKTAFAIWELSCEFPQISSNVLY
jgi:hypothetical protein